MGEFWGFLEGVLKWLAGITDNAIYPVMIANYAKTIFHDLNDETTFRIFLFVCIVLLTTLNWLGLKVVGVTSIVLLVLCLAPFFLMAFIGIPKVEVSHWVASKPLEEVDWGLFLNSLFWNLNGFDSASTVAAEVQNPQKTFPRALLLAGLLVAVQYFFPILVGIGVMGKNASWDDNQYAQIGYSLGGEWLQDWIVFAVAISSVGLFEAEMSGDSFQLLGMAERGMIPRFFMYRSRFGTPTFGILLSAVSLSLCAFLSLQKIIELLNILYVWAFVLQAIALVMLRIRLPDAHRPFRIPLNVPGLLVLFTPPLAYVIAVMRYASIESHIVTALSLVFAVLLYWVMRWLQVNDICEFVRPHGGSKPAERTELLQDSAFHPKYVTGDATTTPTGSPVSSPRNTPSSLLQD
eukprot:c11512_g1_i2.p1 GENE.c11512_g1_i2~~c11512_g1_i2.p1  ORF type:complete len:406 (-),score=80.08 c11512_g1_i2:191-1408(-)